jgi:hypothetical protein
MGSFRMCADLAEWRIPGTHVESTRDRCRFVMGQRTKVNAILLAVIYTLPQAGPREARKRLTELPNKKTCKPSRFWIIIKGNYKRTRLHRALYYR